MADFFERVYNVVKKIPRGRAAESEPRQRRVATYGQIATLPGQPRSAQAVGWALRLCVNANAITWQRIINKVGMISIINERAPKTLQVALLKADGVKVIKKEDNFFVDLKKYGWLK